MLEAHRAITKRNSSFILCLREHYQARSGADHRRPKLSMRVLIKSARGFILRNP